MPSLSSRLLPLRVITALTAGIVLLAVFGASRASAVSDSEELFSILLGQGEGAGEARFYAGAASDPATSHFYLSDLNLKRIDEYTPWGNFVKSIGWDVAPGAVNEQQEVRIKAAEGQFRLGFEGAKTPDMTLESEAKGPKAAEVIKNALDGLSTIGGAGGSVAVTASQGTPDGKTPYIYVVAFKGSLAGKDLGEMTIEPGSEPLGGGQPSTTAEVLTRADGGQATTGLEVCTVESGCKAGLSGGGAGQFMDPGRLAFAGGNLYVQDRRGAHRVQEISPEGRFIRMFGGDVISDGASGTGDLTAGSATVSGVVTTSRFFEVGQRVTGAGIAAATTIVAVGPGTLTLSKPATSSGTGVSIEAPEGTGNVPANARQKIAIEKAQSGAAPTGGTFTATFATPDPSPSSTTTSSIPFGASAAEFEAKLAELPNLDPADIAVTGPAGGPWTVEFMGLRFGGSAPPLLTLSTKDLLPALPNSFEGYGYEVALKTAAEVCTDAPSCRVGAPGIGPGEFSGGPHFSAGSGGFANGSGLATTPTGLAVADHGRIQRFAFDGSFQTELPTPGKTPLALAATPLGNLWAYFSIDQHPGLNDVAQVVPAAIELDGSTGAQLAEIPLSKSPLALANDQVGNLYLGWAPPSSGAVIYRRG